MTILRKLALVAFTLGLALTTSEVSTPTSASATTFDNPNNPGPVFRFYKTDGSHFYTASESEKEQLQRVGGVYRYEGVAFYAYSKKLSDVEAVYRFYKFREGTHFYTANPEEYAALIATASETYRYEGEAYYGSTDLLNSAPVYRFYKFQQGTHFYTVRPDEAQALIARHRDVYRFEGVTFDAPIDLYFAGPGTGNTTPFYLPDDPVEFMALGEDLVGSLHPVAGGPEGVQLFSPDGGFSQSRIHTTRDGLYYLQVSIQEPWAITIRVFDY